MGPSGMVTPVVYTVVFYPYHIIEVTPCFLKGSDPSVIAQVNEDKSSQMYTKCSLPPNNPEANYLSTPLILYLGTWEKQLLPGFNAIQMTDGGECLHDLCGGKGMVRWESSRAHRGVSGMRGWRRRRTDG